MVFSNMSTAQRRARSRCQASWRRMADELPWAMTAAGNAIAIWKGRSISASRRGAAPACADARGPFGAVLTISSLSASNCGALIWAWSSMSSSNPGGGGRLLSPAACRAGLSPNQRSLAGFPRCMKRKIWSTRCIGAGDTLCSELRTGKLPLPYAAGAASGRGEPVRLALSSLKAGERPGVPQATGSPGFLPGRS